MSRSLSQVILFKMMLPRYRNSSTISTGYPSMLMFSVACSGASWIFEDLCHFDIDLHPIAFVGFVMQVFQSLEINCSLVHSCIVVSKLKLLHAGGGTLCARMKLGQVEESAIESVLSMLVLPVGIMAVRYREKSVEVRATSN